jgi:hypothetical protein
MNGPFLFATAGGLKEGLALIEYAEFDIPLFTYPSVRVYRGTAGIMPRASASGVFWSTDRDMACYYAIKQSELGKGDPLVITANMPRDNILMCPRWAKQTEIIAYPIHNNPFIPYSISYPVENWREGYERYNGDR